MKSLLLFLVLAGACSSGHEPSSGDNVSALEQRLLGFFHAHDKNGDGKLTISEYASGTSGRNYESMKQDFLQRDANKDGFVSQDEFILPVMKTSKCIDSNKDGVISLAELDAGVAKCADNASPGHDYNYNESVTG
jgi:Ca2+-binding EF-hand superfamily protein